MVSIGCHSQFDAGVQGERYVRKRTEEDYEYGVPVNRLRGGVRNMAVALAAWER